jgi:hypothetical protein
MANKRAVASVPPPAPAGTMMVTGLSGQAAKALLPKVNTAAPVMLTIASFTVLTNFMLVSLKKFDSVVLPN